MQEIGSRLRFLFPQNVRPSQRFLMRCRCRCHCLRSIQSLDQRLPLRLRIQYFVFSFVGIHLTKNETRILFIIYGSHQQNHPLKAQNQQRKKTIYVLKFFIALRYWIQTLIIVYPYCTFFFFFECSTFECRPQHSKPFCSPLRPSHAASYQHIRVCK